MLFFLIYEYESFVFMGIMYLLGACRGQKRVADPGALEGAAEWVLPEIEPQASGRHPMLLDTKPWCLLGHV